PVVGAARKDARAAADEGVAEGHYLLGQLAEDTGDLAGAIKAYRAAVAAHKALDGEGSRYRVALARALLKSRTGAGAPARPVPPVERTGRASPARYLETLRQLVVLTLQAPDLPDTS